MEGSFIKRSAMEGGGGSRHLLLTCSTNGDCGYPGSGEYCHQFSQGSVCAVVTRGSRGKVPIYHDLESVQEP